MEESIKFIKTLNNSVEQLYDPKESLCSQIKLNLKNLYDISKSEEIKSTSSNSLPELIIQNFDNEQIWQQLELQNDSVLENAIVRVSNLILKEDELAFENSKSVNQNNVNKPPNNEGDEDMDEEVLSDVDSDLSLDESKEGEQIEKEDSSGSEVDDESQKPESRKKSIVDDEFFKLHEMEQFLNSEEKKMDADSGNERESDEEDSDESVDLFEDNSEGSDSEARLAKYKEFFVSKEEQRKPKKNKFLEEFSDVDDEELAQKSSYELRQSRLKSRIDEIESNVMAEKPWQLQGEIKGDSRPQNSLLEEIVEFNRTTRPAPIITGQTTLQLEDIIKQRIKDKVFDSVERKQKPVETPFEYKKQLVLDQEKSKASLAQIYEKEYLDQKAALDPENAEKEETEPDSHKEIRKMMDALFHQLDGLTNFYYTPKPAIPELKIISNAAAINMEEVAPVAMSDAALLAPEEIKKKPKTDVLGKSERDATDKNRERRKKKTKQRYHAKEKQKREELLIKNASGKKIPKKNAEKLLDRITRTSNNVEKMAQDSDRKKIKSSTAFFKQLQEQSQIKSQNDTKKTKSKKRLHDAKRLKL